MRYLLLTLAILFCAVPALAAGLKLDWIDNSTNEEGFNIQRKVGAGNYAALGKVGANVKTYTDTNLAEGVTYCYQVNAYNAAGASAWSNEACGSLPLTIPAAPSALGVSVVP